MAIRDLSFNLIPVKTKLSKTDVVNLDFIGRTSFQVAYGPVVQNILNAFNGNTKSIAFEDIEGLEIVIKPKRRKSINNRVINAIQNLPDNEVERVTMRAKVHLNDQLTNFYYSKDGLLSDACEAETDIQIAAKNYLKDFGDYYLSSWLLALIYLILVCVISVLLIATISELEVTKWLIRLVMFLFIVSLVQSLFSLWTGMKVLRKPTTEEDGVSP